MVRAIAYSKKTGCIREVLYNYHQNGSGSSASELRQYRGDLIYQSVFGAGELILKLYDEIQQESTVVASNIKSGLPWFVNRLFVSLVRTSHWERKVFYRELRGFRAANSEMMNAVVAFMDSKNKFIICFPMLGGLVLDAVSYVYQKKHSYGKN